MKIKTKRFSICECGFPTLKETILIGSEYEVVPMTIQRVRFICGGCKKDSEIYAVLCGPSPTNAHPGFLPAEIFWLPTDEPDTTCPAIFGETKSDPAAMLLGTGFWQFLSPLHCGGLMKWKDGRLDILAIWTEEPGKGQLRAFIRQAMEVSQTICFWSVGNEFLPAVLTRYGFKPVSEILLPGDPEEHGFRWDKPSVDPVPRGTVI